MQQLRHPSDDLEAEECGEDEDVEPDLEVGGGHVAASLGSSAGSAVPGSSAAAGSALASGSTGSPNASRTRGWTMSPPRETRVSRGISSSMSIRGPPSFTRLARKDAMFLPYIWLA